MHDTRYALPNRRNFRGFSRNMMMKQSGPINSAAVIALCRRDKAVEKALNTAKRLYVKVKRKYTNEDYLAHPLTVLSVLLELGFESETYVVASLQDVLAKSNLTETTLRAEFGDAVADKVRALTAPVIEGVVDRDAYQAQLAASPGDIQSIKLASLLHDLVSIPTKQLVSAQPFIGEAAKLIDALSQGHPELLRRVQAVIRNARR